MGAVQAIHRVQALCLAAGLAPNTPVAYVSQTMASGSAGKSNIAALPGVAKDISFKLAAKLDD